MNRKTKTKKMMPYLQSDNCTGVLPAPRLWMTLRQLYCYSIILLKNEVIVNVLKCTCIKCRWYLALKKKKSENTTFNMHFMPREIQCTGKLTTECLSKLHERRVRVGYLQVKLDRLQQNTLVHKKSFLQQTAKQRSTSKQTTWSGTSALLLPSQYM